MPGKPCDWCEAPIRFFTIRGGKALPFELPMTPIGEAGGIGWVPMRGPSGVFMRPTREISERRLEQVRWVAIAHRCAEYEIARMRIGELDWATPLVRSGLMDLAKPRKRRGR